MRLCFSFSFLINHFLDVQNCSFVEKVLSIYIVYQNQDIFQMNHVGPKDLKTPAHLISSPRPMPSNKKCLRTDGENLDLQVVRPRTIVSSVGHNHGREKRHVTRGGPPEDRERDSRPYGLTIGGWWRDNPMRSYHLRIKYTQLTL